MKVYFLPGWGASYLFYRRPIVGRLKLWLNPVLIFLNGYKSMGLAADGLSPGDGGLTLAAEEYYEPVYEAAIGNLRVQLSDTPWTPEAFAWDWRKPISDAAGFLSRNILENVPVGQQCVIIGHSGGGLVARRAWQLLGPGAGQDRVKRIITLGTPHLGTYAAVAPLAGINTHFGYLQTLGQVWTALFITPGVAVIAPRPPTKDQLIAMMATWPALYELFPTSIGPDAQADPNRLLLYRAGNWPASRGIQQQWLTSAVDTQLALSVPGSMPPVGRMTTIAGTGRQTAAKLARSSVPLDTDDNLSDADGDGTVTRTSAQGIPGVRFEIDCGHQQLPLSCVLNGLLKSEVLANRPDNEPVPTPVTAHNPVGPLDLDPQIGNALPSGGRMGICPKGTYTG